MPLCTSELILRVENITLLIHPMKTRAVLTIPLSSWVSEQSMTVNLEQDLGLAIPGITLNAVKDVYVFGDIHIDNIMLLKPTQELNLESALESVESKLK